MKILIVEDESRIREGMAKLISSYTEYEVVGQARNGREGLELIKLYHPDLVITDIRMPEVDGLQMIQQIQAEKINIRTVILSGYSEFEYAKQAINLGVKDYLLKPIGVEDVTKLLQRMAEEINYEINSEKVTCESLLRDIILESSVINESIYRDLMGIGHLSEEMNYNLFVGYTGSVEYKYKEQFEERMKTIAHRCEKDRVYYFYSDVIKQIVCLIGTYGTSFEWKSYFEKRFIEPYKEKEKQVVWSVIQFESISQLHVAYVEAREALNYGLSFKNDQLITQELIKGSCFQNEGYPTDVEEALRASIWRNDKEKIYQNGEAFKLHMRRHHYGPFEIRNSYIQLMTYLSHNIQKIDVHLFQQIEGTYAVKKISEAYTKYEIEKVFDEVLSLILCRKEKKEDITNYTILRAINYIKEHYRDNITLEEVARKLDITPEYLSTLFNREVEINFTTFLKRFRLSQAKRLLKGTSLKIYEVAQQVGYSDSKYFMRVFKEEQGVSPKEFRQQ